MKITLATLPKATPKQVFDQVARHLLTQNEVSKQRVERGVGKAGSDSSCVYHSKHGLKCAAGCLISDNEYNISMEGQTWIYLVRGKKVPSDHKDLIIRLQDIHDNRPVSDWKHELYVLASSCGFSTKVLHENYPSNSTQSNTSASI